MDFGKMFEQDEMNPPAQDIHARALARVARLLLAPETAMTNGQALDTETAQAVQHIAACETCPSDLDALLALVTQGQASLARWTESAEALLGSYAELDEIEARAKYPVVWLHLRVCEPCRETMMHLRALRAKQRAGVFGAVPRGPVFGGAPFWTVQANVQKFFARVTAFRDALGMTWRLLLERELLPPAARSLQIDYVTTPVRGGETPPRTATLSLPIGEMLTLRLTMYPAQARQYDLAVQVVRTPDGEPVANVRAELQTGETPLPAERTGADGTVLFAQLAPKLYTLTLEIQDAVWSIELDFTRAEVEIGEP